MRGAVDQWPWRGGRQGQGGCSPRGKGGGVPQDKLQAARLALLPPAVLGRALSDRVWRGRQARPGPRRPAPRHPPGSGFLPALGHHRGPPLNGAGLGADHPPGRVGPRPPRDKHDASVGGQLLVLPEVPGPGQRRGPHRPRGREVLDASRPLLGGGRARRPSPSLRPLLAQGAVRLRGGAHKGALSAASEPGADPGPRRAHRLHRPPDGGGRERKRRQGGGSKQLCDEEGGGGRRGRARAGRRRREEGGRLCARRRPLGQGALARCQDVQEQGQRRQPR
mmetsp:Transcript_24984/g.63388  ORF Transcript_24984/g.63388 Transcript_24984/m.63388 type:complete len:279 (+) Transcript_24984:51-887(+)